ncbi:MAG: zinc-binding dehydrogenase [Anaerolineales bacterium]|jgi:NADPH:quinone reductase-like Zn-dependent oxidoreductase
MKAAFFRRHGGVEVLEYEEIRTPSPGPGQVLVQVRAAALNHMDLWVRLGWPGLKLEMPHISGADAAGVVAEIGPGVEGVTPGDRVVLNAVLRDGKCEFCRRGQDNLCLDWHLLGETVHGALAEYVIAPQENLLRLPAGFPFDQAAAAGLVFHTAWHSLIRRGKLLPGETVLIVGASGGVNTASIQIAKLAGAAVYVVGSNSDKLVHARTLGADFLIDRSQEPQWDRAVYQLTGKRGVDVVVDNVGTTFPQSFRALRKGGRLLTVGNSGGPKFEIDNRFIFGKHLSILGSSMGTRVDFEAVMALVFAGRLHPVIDQVLPLSAIRLAEERLEQDQQFGKIVLVP